MAHVRFWSAVIMLICWVKNIIKKGQKTLLACSNCVDLKADVKEDKCQT